MSWQDEVDELRRREKLAAAMGGEERIQRQHDNGRLTVRERIDALADANSFHEIGALAGKATYSDDGQLQDFTPSNFVLGTAKINNRRIVIGGDDFTVRGGAADAKIGDKSGYGERYALEMRLPLGKAHRRQRRRWLGEDTRDGRPFLRPCPAWIRDYDAADGARPGRLRLHGLGSRTRRSSHHHLSLLPDD